MSSGRSLVSKEDGVQSCPVLRSRGPRWGRAWIATVGGGSMEALLTGLGLNWVRATVL